MNKHKIILFIAFLLSIVATQAQENEKEAKLRKKYINLSFTNMKMTLNESLELESEYGAAFTVGRTFYLHKKPIGGFLRFGIDATWVDLNYANYKIKQNPDLEKNECHQADISMHIGPSITINPIGKLNLHGYFRYAPTYSAMYVDDTFYGNYAGFFVGGGSVSYGTIGLGIESRFSDLNYKKLGSDEEKEFSRKLKTKLNGWRAYLTFRF